MTTDAYVHGNPKILVVDDEDGARTARLAGAEWGVGVPAERPRGFGAKPRLGNEPYLRHPREQRLG